MERVSLEHTTPNRMCSSNPSEPRDTHKCRGRKNLRVGGIENTRKEWISESTERAHLNSQRWKQPTQGVQGPDLGTLCV